jgi:DNA-directed RNA polymerase specialized sigma24 family protein
MLDGQDIFVLQLARASGRARRFLREQDLRKEDREDVIANAIAWCWERRADYPLTTSLSSWFFSAVRHAYREWSKGELRNASEIIEDIGYSDTSSASAQALDTLTKIKERIGLMDPTEQQIAALLLREWTQEEIREHLNIDIHRIPAVRRKLAPYLKHLPDTADTRWAIRKSVPLNSDDAPDTKADIDTAMEDYQRGIPGGSLEPQDHARQMALNEFHRRRSEYYARAEREWLKLLGYEVPDGSV